MTNGKTISIIAISVVATLAIASISGFQLNEITAEESSEKKYKFANDVEIVGIFTFDNGATELVEFQVFHQDTGFKRSSESVSFDLIKELNDQSPLLYKIADTAWKYGDIPGMDYMTDFDVQVLLAKGGEVIRQFDYSGCTITEYEVDTLYDKEEAWFGKGFAVTDEFEILCEGYEPVNPTYEKTNGYTKKSDSVSTLDLIEADKARKAMMGQ